MKIAIHCIKPYEFIRKIAIHSPKPYEFIGEIAIHCPKPDEAAYMTKEYRLEEWTTANFCDPGGDPEEDLKDWARWISTYEVT